MQEILFYRELDFSLKSIQEILSDPHYDKEKALQEQKKLLQLKKGRLERLICAIDSAMKGEIVMNAFDNSEFETYKAEAREKWGKTDAYKEYGEKTKSYSKENWSDVNEGLMAVFADFAACMKNGETADSAAAQETVKKLQSYITANFYNCTSQILAGLGQMYVLDERFRNNIDKHGDGTAAFASKAIEIYCK